MDKDEIISIQEEIDEMERSGSPCDSRLLKVEDVCLENANGVMVSEIWYPFIDREAFRGSKVAKLILRVTVESVGSGAFADCKRLEAAEFQVGLRAVGVEAFAGCSKLRRVNLPKSVEFIGENAFCDCPKLTIRTPAGSYAEEYARENGLRVSLY